LWRGNNKITKLTKTKMRMTMEIRKCV
jgi:hypothetical protein